ncbi:MAG: hypothetical protein GX083_00385 [Clostridiales bacterium]|nr:hypothetical protein [Clostridiales bacterium]
MEEKQVKEYPYNHESCGDKCDRAIHHGYDIEEMEAATSNKYSKEDLVNIIHSFDKCGEVLEAKGVVKSVDGSWLKFEYVPRECEIRKVEEEKIGLIEIKGENLKKEKVKELFRL